MGEYADLSHVRSISNYSIPSPILPWPGLAPQVAALLKSMDSNRDTVLSPAEFKSWLFPARLGGADSALVRALRDSSLLQQKFGGDVKALFEALDR